MKPLFVFLTFCIITARTRSLLTKIYRHLIAIALLVLVASCSNTSIPSITSFSPSQGTSGSAVTLTGSNFSSVVSVTFGGVAADSFTIEGTSKITAIVPVGAASGEISVAGLGGSDATDSHFTVVVEASEGEFNIELPVMETLSAWAPTLVSFSPTSGAVGSTVEITGSNFTLSGATLVKFGETAATSISVSGTTKIIATVPANAITGALSVTTDEGTATSATDFTVVAATAKPKISSFTPTSGDIGSTVIITGSNFTGATALVFGSTAVPATYTVDSATQMTAIVPVAASGTMTVTTAGGVASSSSIFTVTGSFSGANISAVMSILKKHLTGEAPLSESQIVDQMTIFQQNNAYLNADETVIKDVFDLVDFYDVVKGALFVSELTKKGFNRTATISDGLELERAIFTIQQALQDNVFTAASVKTYQTLLNGRSFKTSIYFPGAAIPPVDATVSYEIAVNCRMPASWGKPTSFSSSPVRRPTGLYLAPGSVATVTVPSNMVNKGFSILVGAHTWDKTTKTKLQRFDRVTNSFPVTSEVTPIANPFGGGVYIVVPYLADFGVVNIQATNVIKAPFFSFTSTRKMTLDDWKIQRANPAPWADFESDKYMMQVPTNWIYAYEDPLTLMQNWDKAMDGMSEFLGYPTQRNRTVLYQQVDVSIAHTAYGIGDPMVNYTYDPYKVESGNKSHNFLTNPLAWNTTYHELGHDQLFSKFSGETEAIVNFPYVYISNVKFNNDINEAFALSGYDPYMSRDEAAIDWMVTENFRNNKAMDISNTTKNEMRYQSRGYAKYMDIALLFGWEALTNFYLQEQMDYINGTPSDGLKADDSRILRLSVAAGVDVTPLIYFWGTHPVEPDILKEKISAAGLAVSKEIFDLLVYYKSIAPKSNADFKAQQLALYPTLPSGGNSDYGYGWYSYWADIFDESEGEGIQVQLQNIIDMYGLE